MAAEAVISEFMAVNESWVTDDDGEYRDWIEVSNIGDESLDLSGWHLTDDVADRTKWEFPAVNLGAGEQLVVFASDKDRRDPASQLHTNFRLSGDGEYLALVEPDGSTVADEYAPAFPEQYSNVSFGLSATTGDIGYLALPTPGAGNLVPASATPPSALVINEIMYHPASENDAHEYVELINIGSSPVDLTGWRVSGGIDADLPALTIGAGELIVVSADPASFVETYGEVPNLAGPWTGRLGNTSDTIRLRNATDQVVDRVTYSDEGEWAVRERGPDDFGSFGWQWSDAHDGGGKSLELTNARMPNEHGQNWHASEADGGTPGVANSNVTQNAAPFVLDVEQLPVIPRTTEPVVVSAEILDESLPQTTVAVYWRLDGAADYTESLMNDEGLNGDLIAGDGTFSATLPPQVDRTVVEYYVGATDNDNQTRTWPAPTLASGQAANALYQVIDEFDAEPAKQPGARPVYYQIMTAAERQEFTDINRRSNAEMNATFIRVDGNGVTQRHNAGIRMRGSGSRFDTPANNRVNLPSDRAMNGMTAFNFNTDTVRNQIVGSTLFRLAGLPIANATAATMYSNGENLKPDFYALLEPLNGEFADRHFPSDPNGNLYKGRRPNESPEGGQGAGLFYRGEDPLPYSSYTKLTNESQADWSDVMHLTDVLNNTDDESYLTEIAKVADVDQWIRFLAFNALISNTEGGLVNGDRNGDDYAMYRGVEDPRFIMITHDLDSILSLSNASITRTVTRAANVPALRRMMLHPELRPKFYQAFFDLMDEVFFSPDTERAVRESLRGVVDEGQIDAVFEFFDRRAEFLRSFIPQGIDYTAGLPIEEGRVVTNERAMPVYGFADYRANSVLVNGELAQFFDTNNFFQYGSFITNVVGFGDEWSYLDDGSDQGTAWKELDFVEDGAWKRGTAELGYGDGDESTVIEFGGDPENVHVTTYFRREFNIDDPSRWDTLSVSLVRDDGAAVYINGQEVVRDNLPGGELTAATLASRNQGGSAERAQRFYDLDPSLLRPGKNVIAVEVHQAAIDSPDLSFRLRLSGRVNQRNGGASLQPGLNRYVIQAMSGRDGTGDVVATEVIEVWRTEGSRTVVDSDLPAGETRWLAANGPYIVSGSVTVPDDATLVIEPGTSVYFVNDGEADGELEVAGTLVAQGTAAQRIRFTSDPSLPDVPQRDGLPDGPDRWDGIHFRNSNSTENVIAFADIEYAEDNDGAIGVIGSHVRIDNVNFSGAHARYVFGNRASMRLSNSVFPDMFPGDESPIELGLDNIAEHVKIIGRTPAGGELVIQGNTFGTNKGHNDVIDADSNRVTNGPILQVLDNVFAGAGDELLDLGGDVFVAGNHFMNVFKDDTTSDRGYANVMSTGDAGTNTTIVVTRNYFYDVDHAINLKNSTATIFEHNTVVKIHPDFNDRFGHPNVGSAINFYVDEPRATTGKGAYVAHNVFWDLPRVFGNADLPNEDTVTILQLENNLLSPEVAATEVADRGINTIDIGPGNVAGDPRFVDLDGQDFTLRPGSIANDPQRPFVWGAEAEAKLWATTPATPSFDNTAELTVGGPGMFAFRYRVNDGEWSDELPIGDGFQEEGTVRTAVIELSGLAPGEQRVELEGRDFAGNWQAEPTVVTWTVDPNANALRINEVLAANRSISIEGESRVDAIELYNAGNSAINLKGMKISDRADDLDKHVFQEDLFVPARGYLTLFVDGSGADDRHLGFALSSKGESVFLATADGTIVDQVVYGWQVDDLSIGRVGPLGEWTLTEPSLGNSNQAALVGDPEELVINEWLADSDMDFMEIYNRDSLPVDMSGLLLTDVGDATRDRFAAPPLSYIPRRGFVALDEGDLGFGLSNDSETLRLSYPDGRLIDTIVYAPQVPGVSEGRSPDGQSNFDYFENPTPGWANGAGEPGDLNLDGILSADDIDMFCQLLRDGGNDDATDLNGDGVGDLDDHRYLVENLFGSSFGDANLDGVFDSRDLVTVFQTGQYEDGVPGNSSWATGDWNCDGEFGTADLVIAFQRGNYRV